VWKPPSSAASVSHSRHREEDVATTGENDVVCLLCQWVLQPVIRLIQIVVSIIETVLVQVCRLIKEIVATVISVLKYLCNTIVHTVCGAVCSVVCGICDLFCGIFGCDCGCENICNNVCKTVTDVVCGWTYVLETVLNFVTTVVCDYIIKAIIIILHLVEAIVTMVLTWLCSLVDDAVRWLLCLTYAAEIFNNTDQRRFKVAPRIVRNDQGYSDWFVYVNNPNASGSVDQNLQGYILSDQGRPLTPVVSESHEITYYEVETKGDTITSHLKRGRDGAYIPGTPFLFYAYKMIEVASHLFGDAFANAPGDDGRGTDPSKNLHTYNPNVQAWLDSRHTLARNNYNAWPGKFTSGGSYFGDGTNADFGLRVDTDSTCSHPTNAFLHLVTDIMFTPASTDIAEKMTCGASQTLTFDETNFLMLNKDSDGSAVTTYLVSTYDQSESSVGCNDVLGYTVVTFKGSGRSMRVLPFHADTNRMMAAIVDDISSDNSSIVRVSETYLHECGHQSGLVHDSDPPDCKNGTTLNIAKLMDPGGSVRRALTRNQWCMIRTSCYVTSRSLDPFMQAPELPDSGSVPTPQPAPHPPANP
jgi:hypothetical protein